LRITDLPTLRDRYSPRANSLGFLRLALALAVLVAHAWPLGLGEPDPGRGATRGQTDLGALAVDGFFVLSGFLVAASARRLGPVRFAWHRFLRIFPGLWVCLMLIAVSATVAGSAGGLGFAAANWSGAVHRWGIGTLFLDTPYGRLVHGSVVDGSLWSLAYELLCYAGLAVLIALGLTRRAPWVVPLLAGGALLVIAADVVRDLPASGLVTTPQYRGGLGPFPLLGYVDEQLACYLGFLFLLGASFQLYAHRVPAHPAVAAGCAALFAASLFLGGFFIVGYVTYAYLLLYAACALPARLRRVGREHDYSYGIYIYAFPVQQLVAHLGGASRGVLPYLAVCVPAVLLCAAASWHLVERPALSLKHLLADRGDTVQQPVTSACAGPSGRRGRPWPRPGWAVPRRGWRRRPGPA
jgi:peptidoglycan/LPS O-acetylase OafA/YrhL